MISLNHCNCCFGQFLVRSISVQSARECNPYKVLGLSPTATQAEIKSAFYDLSKKHHPDKNQGCEKSAKKFKDITAAYEILRNEKLRSKFDKSFAYSNDKEFSSNYDRPFSRHRTASASSRVDYNDEAERKFYEKTSRVKQRKFYSKTSYYDFDAWFRAHYGNLPPKSYKFQSNFRYEKPEDRSMNTHEFHSYISYIVVFGFVYYLFSTKSK